MASAVSERLEVAPGAHVCWVVSRDDQYEELACAVLADAARANERPLAFGPADSAGLAALRNVAAIVGDPRIAFLGGGPLDPDAMFAMFREQMTAARNEGFSGLRLVADMDWLLPMQPTLADLVGFELLLDRLSHELGATIVCAYRSGSFADDLISAVCCVHPDHAGQEPVGADYRLVAGAGDTWRLVGEVDLAAAVSFAAAVEAAANAGDCTIDASELSFIDVAGLRQVAHASRASGLPIRITGASPLIRRCWKLAGFDELAPAVELAA